MMPSDTDERWLSVNDRDISVIRLRCGSAFYVKQQSSIRDTLKVAIYGKGGIGKSTVSCNISFAASRLDRSVLQIGCDPKCDSVRALLGKKARNTVTEYIRDVPPSRRKLEDIITRGSNGIMCVEAGGPKPGIGCAGKGIVSMFQTLEKIGCGEIRADMTVFDVLGDVVCGGFAVPMRPENSDMVVIVTSGEFMSIFAANNILKGSLSFVDGKGRIAGLVLNRRGVENEDALVTRFAEAAGIPVLCTIPRSGLFAEAESACRTVCELFPESDESKAFTDLASRLLDMGPDDTFVPTPLTDTQLDTLFSTGTCNGHGAFVPDVPEVKRTASVRPVIEPVRRIGKGPVAAVLEGGKVMDIPVIVHGTASCGYTMLREVSEERIRHLVRDPEAFVSSGENIVCSNMTPASSMFGGTGDLTATIERLIRDNPITLVISTCLPGIVGDDCEEVIRRMTASHPGSKILFVDANRVDSGFDAHIEVIRALSTLIDENVEPSDGYVNVADDSFITFNRGRNREYLSSVLSEIDMSLGPGFLNDCNVRDITGCRRFGPASLTDGSEGCRAVGRMLESKGIRVMEHPLPRGLNGTVEWLTELSGIAGRDVSACIGRVRCEYRRTIDAYTDALKDKSIAVITPDVQSDSWIAETLEDAGCHVTVLTPSSENASVATVFGDRLSLDREIKDLVPDAVIDCMGISDHPGRIPGPETWATHRASADLVRSVWGRLRSGGGDGWKRWRD